MEIMDGDNHGSECVSAVITPNNTRQYKVNGKLKTGKEVREHLRRRGLCLEHTCCIIKQAEVTRLADLNSKFALAAALT